MHLAMNIYICLFGNGNDNLTVCDPNKISLKFLVQEQEPNYSINNWGGAHQNQDSTTHNNNTGYYY